MYAQSRRMRRGTLSANSVVPSDGEIELVNLAEDQDPITFYREGGGRPSGWACASADAGGLSSRTSFRCRLTPRVVGVREVARQPKQLIPRGLVRACLAVRAPAGGPARAVLSAVSELGRLRARSLGLRGQAGEGMEHGGSGSSWACRQLGRVGGSKKCLPSVGAAQVRGWSLDGSCCRRVDHQNRTSSPGKRAPALPRSAAIPLLVDSPGDGRAALRADRALAHSRRQAFDGTGVP